LLILRHTPPRKIRNRKETLRPLPIRATLLPKRWNNVHRMSRIRGKLVAICSSYYYKTPCSKIPFGGVGNFTPLYPNSTIQPYFRFRLSQLLAKPAMTKTMIMMNMMEYKSKPVLQRDMWIRNFDANGFDTSLVGRREYGNIHHNE
jgi:hypothetical protein